MRFWIVCFAMLFGVAELFPGGLPQVVFWGLGVVLAIASNANKLPGLSTSQRPVKLADANPNPAEKASSAKTQRSPQLPTFQPTAKPQDSISFTIRKPES